MISTHPSGSGLIIATPGLRERGTCTDRGRIQRLKCFSASLNSCLKAITSKKASLGGKIKGNVNSDKIQIKKTGVIEGVLTQKTLSIEEGASLKIKTETYK